MKNRIVEALKDIFLLLQFTGDTVWNVLKSIVLTLARFIAKVCKKVFGTVFGWAKRKLKQPLYDIYCYLLTPIAHAWGALAHSHLHFKKAKKISFWHGVRSVFMGIGKVLKGIGVFGKYAFNYIAPAVCLLFLFSLIKYASTLQYAVSVEYNGTDLGVISDAATYNQAQSLAQDQVTLIGDEDDFLVRPTFSIQMIEQTDETVDADTLSELILSSGEVEIVYAYGFYINDELLGVYDETEMKRIQTALEDRLAKYYTSRVSTVDFVDDVVISQGRFVSSNLSNADWAIKLIDSEMTVEAYYVIQKGDSVSLIASKLGITQDELLANNEFLEDGTHTGDLVKYFYTEPYLSVMTTHYETYDQDIERQVVYTYNNDVEAGCEILIQSGSAGYENVTALVTEVNGVESTRTIISRTVLEEMVPRIFETGTQPNTYITEENDYVIDALGTFCWPVEGGYISSLYGWRSWDKSNHKALDIAAKKGTPIYAAADGVVTFSGTKGTYGKLVIIDHGQGYETYYSHQYMLACEEGDVVEKGDLIGYIGMTGSASGNHLHFELRLDGDRINPLLGLGGIGDHYVWE